MIITIHFKGTFQLNKLCPAMNNTKYQLQNFQLLMQNLAISAQNFENFSTEFHFFGCRIPQGVMCKPVDLNLIYYLYICLHVPVSFHVLVLMLNLEVSQTII